MNKKVTVCILPEEVVVSGQIDGREIYCITKYPDKEEWIVTNCLMPNGPDAFHILQVSMKCFELAKIYEQNLLPIIMCW